MKTKRFALWLVLVYVLLLLGCNRLTAGQGGVQSDAGEKAAKEEADQVARWQEYAKYTAENEVVLSKASFKRYIHLEKMPKPSNYYKKILDDFNINGIFV